MSKLVETGHPAYTKFFSPVNKDIVPVKWLLKGVMEENSINGLFGPSGEKKSFVVIDMALHILNGKDWYGHKVKQKNVTVLYIAGEGAAGINLRVNAACKHHNLSSERFFVSNSSVDMMDTDTVADLVDMVKSVEGPVWVILDTLNRNFAGDENSSKDMAMLWKNIDMLRSVGATFTMVHHTGHGSTDRARGSSSIKGAMDGEIRVSTDGKTGQTTVTNTKNKNVGNSSEILLESLSVSFGKDEDGDNITSLAMITSKKKVVDSSVTLDIVAKELNELLPMTQSEIDVLIASKLDVSESTAAKKKKPLIKEILINKFGMLIVNKQWVKGVSK